MKETNNKNGYFLSWEKVKKDWPLWFIMVGLFISAAFIYPHLPEQIPRHWNFKGEVDAYWGRLYGAFIPLVVIVACYFLMLFVPYLDPKKENYIRFTGAYTFIRWMLVLFLSLLYITTILAAMGYNLDMDLWVKAMVAVLFILIGNFMGQFRHNYFVGIKTAWTLADEDVWRKTHRLGAKVWVLGGIVCLIMAFVDNIWGAIVFFAAIIIMTLIPVIYSYVIFRKTQH